MPKQKFVYVVCHKENLCAVYRYFGNRKRALAFVHSFKPSFPLIVIKHPLY